MAEQCDDESTKSLSRPAPTLSHILPVVTEASPRDKTGPHAHHHPPPTTGHAMDFYSQDYSHNDLAQAPQPMTEQCAPMLCHKSVLRTSPTESESQNVLSDLTDLAHHALVLTAVSVSSMVRADSAMSVYHDSSTMPAGQSPVKLHFSGANPTPFGYPDHETPALINPRPMRARQIDIAKRIATVRKAFPGASAPDRFPYGHFIPELIPRPNTTPPERLVRPKNPLPRRNSSSTYASSPMVPSSNVMQDSSETQGSRSGGPSFEFPSNNGESSQGPSNKRRRTSENPNQADGQIAIAARDAASKPAAKLFPCVHFRCESCEKVSKNCQIRHNCISPLARHHRAPHLFFYCTTCFERFNTDSEWKSHEDCQMKCVTTGCSNYRKELRAKGECSPSESACDHGKSNTQMEQWKELYRMAHDDAEPPDIFTGFIIEAPSTTARPPTDEASGLQFRMHELRQLLSTIWKNLLRPDYESVEFFTISDFYDAYWIIRQDTYSHLPVEYSSLVHHSEILLVRMWDLYLDKFFSKKFPNSETLRYLWEKGDRYLKLMGEPDTAAVFPPVDSNTNTNVALLIGSVNDDRSNRGQPSNVLDHGSMAMRTALSFGAGSGMSTGANGTHAPCQSSLAEDVYGHQATGSRSESQNSYILHSEDSNKAPRESEVLPDPVEPFTLQRPGASTGGKGKGRARDSGYQSIVIDGAPSCVPEPT